MSCYSSYNYGSLPKGTFRIIQGDTFQRTIVVRLTGGDKLECIRHIYFSCDRLDISKELPIKIDPKTGKEMKGYYKLLLTAEETAELEKCNTTYDITIDFGPDDDDKVVKTIRYQYPLEVLRKTNEVYQLK